MRIFFLTKNMSNQHISCKMRIIIYFFLILLKTELGVPDHFSVNYFAMLRFLDVF